MTEYHLPDVLPLFTFIWLMLLIMLGCVLYGAWDEHIKRK